MIWRLGCRRAVTRLSEMLPEATGHKPPRQASCRDAETSAAFTSAQALSVGEKIIVPQRAGVYDPVSLPLTLATVGPSRHGEGSIPCSNDGDLSQWLC